MHLSVSTVNCYIKGSIFLVCLCESVQGRSPTFVAGFVLLLASIVRASVLSRVCTACKHEAMKSLGSLKWHSLSLSLLAERAVTGAPDGVHRPVPWGEFRLQRYAGDYADLGEEIQIDHYRLPATQAAASSA